MASGRRWLAAGGIGTAFAVAGQTDNPAAIIASAQQAFVDGWRQSMWVGVAVSALLFAFVLFRGPVQQSSEARGKASLAQEA